ncbi:MAG: type I DNA topoisomerase [Bacteroidales bacterium]|nr:type I DNA topoisomerase [Bacteroidales bacterium]
MSKNLVIVESPAKAKTIEKFLGKDFKVKSSYGHIRDLKKKDFSIDIEHDFAPIYEIPADKKELVADLKNEASKAEMVWLASDEDREGEAIAWHLYEVLGLKPETTKRIVFHEITKNAILKAIDNPRDININLVDAQQARRVLDRIVGFELSPVLWKKVKPALSAGRVQSVAVRLIVEREREINNFKSEAAYRVVALFTTTDDKGKRVELRSELNTRFKTKDEALSFLEKCKDSTFSIESVTKRPLKKSPAAPFTTSTLQQEAARKLGYSVSQTMMISQRLYESGLITYMRTDSVNLSSLALNAAKEEIEKTMGEEYVKTRNYHTKSKGAQEAHEAIRPTYLSNQQIEGSAQEKRLYELIWKRTIASQMSDAVLEKTTIEIAVSNQKEKFVTVGEVIKFDGFLKVYIESTDDDEKSEGDSKLLPPLTTGTTLELNQATATERFTQRPARYSEASLVRKMEELGIGRPSTYAPTISTIQNREYVEKGDKEGQERTYNVITLKDNNISQTTQTEITGADKGKLIPTDIGTIVNDFLTEHFPNIMDYNFTANVEQEFDHVAEGMQIWTKAIDSFYKMFHPDVVNTLALRTETRVGERILGTDPKTGRQVSVKISRFGPVVQIGKQDEEEKPLFASLLKGHSMSTITLEEALKLFELPRQVGEYEGKVVTIGVGRFGPYVRHDSKYVSLPKEFEPMTVTLDESIALIEAKRKQESERLIKTFEQNEALQILNGRFGPYITLDKNNYKIPKGTDPKALTYEECMEIIKTADENPKPVRGRKTAAKSAASSKTKASAKAKSEEKEKKSTAKKTTTAKKSTAKKTKQE